VTIEAGKKSDKVYYTTDGSEPTEAGRPYSAPITVLPKMTLKVRAFAKNAPPSEIVSFTYGLRGITPPPVTTQPAKTPAPPPVTTQPATMPATAPAAGGGQ